MRRTAKVYAIVTASVAADAKIVALAPARQRHAMLTDLVEDLLISRLETPTAALGPVLAMPYPLHCLESPSLIGALSCWMDRAGEDGVFIEGRHGISLHLPAREPALFGPFGELVEIVPGEDPAGWPRLHIGGDWAPMEPHVGQVVAQSDVEQIARGRPGVCRISAAAAGRATLFDRLWLPIAAADGRILRYVAVTQPLV